MTDSAAGARIEVRGLTWRPYGAPHPILDDLDLTVEPGERVLLAGPSGSGKSTLLRGIGGLLLTADAGDLSGEVLVDGRGPHDVPGGIGLVLQDPGAGAVASTVARDVAFGLENVRAARSSMPPTVASALRAVALDVPLERAPDQLSGGQSQRLALAGALAMSPRVLLLDEPTAMLDPATAAGIRTVVDEVARARGLTLVVVEHRLEGWLDLVDRLVVLDAAGHVLADGAPRAVLGMRARTLGELGIWVPGLPEPAPLRVDLPVPGVSRPEEGLCRPEARLSRPEEALSRPEVALSRPEVGLSRVVEARGVSVVHETRHLDRPTVRTVAVQNADITVERGQAVAIVGPSGAGKTSLMHAATGISAPTSGDVELLGRPDPARWPSTEIAAALAWVPQRAASALVARTVFDEVMTTPRALGHDEAAATARADALLTAMGLQDRRDTDPRNLSGGEQRRLAVAAALAHGPALVVADEPTIGQDRHTWAAVIGAIAAARGEGAGVLATTHDPGVIARAHTVLTLEPPPAPVRSGDPEPVRRTLISRANPLALFLVSLMVLPLPALLENWRQGLTVLATETVLGGIGLMAFGRGRAPEGRWRGVAIRLAFSLIAVLGVAWSTWLLGGRDLEIAAHATLRVLCLVVPSAFVLGAIDPDRLGDHLAQNLRLPARPVVAATAALSRLQSFTRLWSELMTTRRIRGIGAERGLVNRTREALAVTGDLLVGAIGQASGLALAMDARGFASAQRRTWAGPAPWRTPDVVALLVGALVLGVAVLARSIFPG